MELSSEHAYFGLYMVNSAKYGCLENPDAFPLSELKILNSRCLVYRITLPAGFWMVEIPNWVFFKDHEISAVILIFDTVFSDMSHQAIKLS